VTVDELAGQLTVLLENVPDAGGLPVVVRDSTHGEAEVRTVAVEVPYTGIGRWVVLT